MDQNNENYCRICLHHEPDARKSIFNNTIGGVLAVADAIKTVFDINVKPSDQVTKIVPKRICDLCQQRLKLCVEFRNLALMSHDRICSLKEGESLFPAAIEIKHDEPSNESQENPVENEVVLPQTEGPRIFAEIEETLTEMFAVDPTNSGENILVESREVETQMGEVELENRPEIDHMVDMKKEDSESEEPGRSSSSDDETLDLRLHEILKEARPSMNLTQRQDGGSTFGLQEKDLSAASNSNLETSEKTVENRVPEKLAQKESIVDDKTELICDVCLKTFKWKTSLMRHLHFHFDIRNFECRICQKTFVMKSNLKRHIRVHTGVKPFSCPKCKKKFCQSGSLKQHLATHSSSRPFGCAKCDKKFKIRSTVYKHVLAKHGRDALKNSILKI